jgi:hypothetical protein
VQHEHPHEASRHGQPRDEYIPIFETKFADGQIVNNHGSPFLDEEWLLNGKTSHGRPVYHPSQNLRPATVVHGSKGEHFFVERFKGTG